MVTQSWTGGPKKGLELRGVWSVQNSKSPHSGLEAKSVVEKAGLPSLDSRGLWKTLLKRWGPFQRGVGASKYGLGDASAAVCSGLSLGVSGGLPVKHSWLLLLFVGDP